MQALRNLFLRAPDPAIATSAPASPREALAAVIAKVEAEKVVQGELRGRLTRITEVEALADKARQAVDDFKAGHSEVVRHWLLHGGDQPRIDGEALATLEAAYRDAAGQAAAAAASRPETERLLLAAIERHTALVTAMQPHVRAVLGEEMERQQIELSRHVQAAAAVIERLEGLRLLNRDHLNQNGTLLVQGIGKVPDLPLRSTAKGAARQTWRRLANRLATDPHARYEDAEDDHTAHA